jgi:hypothetical protein
MHDVFNITPETHTAYADYRMRVQAALDDPNRARIEEVDSDGFKRWLVHNFRRQPSGGPKRYLL